jgi:hypothetical protein
MSIKDFAEKYFKAEDEAWYNGNFTLLDELEDPNMVIHMPSPLPDLVGHEAHVQDIMSRRQIASDFKLEWRYLTGEKTLYAVSLKFSFRNNDGKKVSSIRLCVGRLEKGRLSEAWVEGNVIISD